MQLKLMLLKDVYNAKINNIEDKIPDMTNLATNTNLNAKINEIRNKIPRITYLSTTAALTTVENKMPNVSDLFKKQIMMQKYQKWKINILLLLIIISSRVIHLMQRQQKKLVNEYDLNEKIKTLATKEEIKTLATNAELKSEQDRIVKLQVCDLSLFTFTGYFVNDGLQNYLVFQPIHKTIRTFSGLPHKVSEWESKGLSNEKFTPPYTVDKSLSPKLIWNNSRIKLKFEGSYLKQEDKAPFTSNNVVNLFIVYELDTWS